MQSLFLVSLPRSLSTTTYRLIRHALPLREPSWAANGEVLNLELHRLNRWSPLIRAEKYLTPEREPGDFAAALEYLGQTIRPRDHLYKDVVNPFVLHRWPGLSELRVLKIERDVSEVAFAMRRRGWYYPAHADDRLRGARSASGS